MDKKTKHIGMVILAILGTYFLYSMVLAPRLHKATA